jgi:DNA-binding response OmpR family regulator
MQVLLVSLDKLFRKALARECRGVGQPVRCVESDDGMGAMFSTALDRMDLILLDAALVRHHGPAWLTNWRRMTPQGDVLVLDAASDATYLQVREAVARIRERLASA